MTPGRIFVFIILGVGALGTLVSREASIHIIYVRLLYLGGFLILVAALISSLSLRGIKVDRQARSMRGSVGDIFEERFEIWNDSHLPKLLLEVANESDIPHSTGSRVLTLLRPHQKRIYVSRNWLTRRGGFVLGPTTISSGDPFGIFRVSQNIPARTSLVVLPMLFPIAEFGTPPGLLPGGRAIRSKALDITPHASGVREYITGDPMKRIHWPTSIRRDQLMVKEFEQDPQSEVWLFMDTHRGVHFSRQGEDEVPPVDDLFLLRRRQIKLAPSSLEYAVSITASLAHYFLEQRRAVGLVTASHNNYTVISAERSERQEAKILEELAFLQAESTYTLPTLVTAQMGQLPQGSSAILVTPMIWSELLMAVDSLQRRKVRPVVILLMIESFGSRTNNEELALQVMQRNVPVCKIYCDADLSETLSKFSETNFVKDVSWRQPVLSHLT